MEQPTDKPNSNAECSNERSTSIFVSSLETINDDCLHEILQYLDIMDIVNLSTASKRLLQFSKTDIFPRAAKQICISDCYPYPMLLTAQFYNGSSIELTLQSIETAFRYFGEFVEDLTLENFRFKDILANCQYLKKLSFRNYDYYKCRIHGTQQNKIEKLQYLNELSFYTSSVNTCQFWRASNAISNVSTLNMGAMDYANSHFVESFKNLTSLSGDLNIPGLIENSIKIIDNNSHCLKHLKLKIKSTDRHMYESIARVITERLTKLENLALEMDLTDETMYLIQLPHLKSVSIKMEYDDTSIDIVNSILQMLSENGIIEELSFRNEDFNDGVANAQPPLNFNKLRSFSWTYQRRFSGILKIFTKSKMPEIQTVQFHWFQTNDLDDLVEFIESKNSLKTIGLWGDHNFIIPLTFWSQIIEILKGSLTPKRPILGFVIHPFQFEDKVKELLTSNRNLIKVECGKLNLSDEFSEFSFF